ncbi:MAG TPA: bifunctional 5,10-methylenetetrahydrofolate dehydrogenase/5,10-methenyltetrahydrofolate cyclohydrolase [Pyrinomonadaceae bacterium]|nr:bifunctional 5,10-methylenetetrahydrofolate dehydrogenase/5,10-methenyltetrahydrofolate cyclohydrolase [Pyrinomonadaceae bacterium]
MVAENIKSESQKRAELLDGAVVAEKIKREVKSEIEQMRERLHVQPGLAAVRVGDDPASAVYVKNKIKACEDVGIRSEHLALPESTTSDQLLALIQDLNARADIDGILVQLPLPKGIDETRIIEAVSPDKDVDGFHPVNVGKLAMGRQSFVPCTPAGIVELLDYHGIQMRGAAACVVGRSQIVGRPMVQLLLQRDATVTICHSRTKDLAAVTREADLLIVAIGRAGMIGKEHIKPGATIIDVGMNKLTEPAEIQALFGSDSESRLKALAKRGYTLVGDVNPFEADQVAGKRTPVPGGVGLLTVAMLMKNTLMAAKLRMSDKL